MKKTYECPMIEVIYLDGSDVITTSGIVDVIDIPGDGE